MQVIRRLIGPAALTIIGAAIPLLSACGSSGTPPAASTAAPVAPTTAAPAAKSPASPAPAAVSPSAASSAAKTAGSPSPAAGTTVLIKENAALGRYLTDSSGRTLYKFARDTPDTSACVDACAQTWPPLPAPTGSLTAPAGVTGTLAAFARPDGKRQVSYKGAPLYTYAADSQPDDTKGNGVGGNWSVVAP